MREHPPPTAAKPPVVLVYTLGGFRVIVDGHQVEDNAWRRKTARQLLKLLLSRPGRRMTRDEVIELFWPESDSDAASSNLRSTVHALRRAIEDSSRNGGLGLVFGDRDSIWLRPDVELWFDADAFEQAVEQAWRSPDPLPLYERASALYIGDYLPDDLYEDWTAQRRDALKRSWTDMQFQLASKYLERGQPEMAISALQRLLTADQCDERAAQELMQVLVRLRRRSEAMRVFQNLEQALRQELDVEPSERSRELQQQASAPDGLAPPRTAFQCSYTFPQPKQLVGREAELSFLKAALERGRTAGQAVLISAPPGTGKSALVGTLVKSARRTGVLCLAGAAYDERSAVPLAAFQEAFTDYVLAASSRPLGEGTARAAAELIEAVRGLREHPSLSRPTRQDVSDQRARLFAAALALLRTLAEHSPVLVCLEDLHAADEATLHLLHYLIRQTRRTSIVFVATFRGEELVPGEPLSTLLAALTREQLAERLELTPLNEPATSQLVLMLAGRSVTSSLSRSLYAASDGNPLFVEQLVLTLREDGRLDGDLENLRPLLTDASTVPSVVRELIEGRLARLSRRAQETLETAAVLGHAFDYADLLAIVDPVDEETLLTDLDAAIRAQLLRERPTGFTFSHSLMREGVYWSLSRPKRMLLHGRAGDVLERRAGENALDMAAELANHFTSAGLATRIQTKAVTYSIRAGRQATALASHREALRHFEAACGLIDGGGAVVDPETMASAFEGRGFAQDATGRFAAGITNFRKVLELASDPVVRARARREICFALNHLGNTSEAEAEAELGLSELAGAEGSEAGIERLVLQHQLAWLWFLRGRFRDVLRLGLSMLDLAKQLDEPRWLAWAHTIVGSAHTGSGRTSLALEQYEAILSTAEQGASNFDLARNRANLGLEYFRAGHFADARANLERAVELYRESFSEPRAILALYGLGRVYLALGQTPRAQEYADIAGGLARDTQDRWQAECLQLSAALHALRAEWDAAVQDSTQALEIHKRVGHVAAMVESLVQIGSIAEARQAQDDAQEAYRQAVSLADQMDTGPCVVAAHRHFGLLLLLKQQDSTGAEHIEHAVELAETMRGSLEYAPTLLARARLERQNGDVNQALDTVAQVFLAPLTADVAAMAHVTCAHLLLEVSRTDEASAHVAEGLRLATGLGSPLLLASAHHTSAAVAAAVNDQTAATQALASATRYFETAGLTAAQRM